MGGPIVVGLSVASTVCLSLAPLAAVGPAPRARSPADDEAVRSVSAFPRTFSTLEDIYGETKEFFQGSVGFWTFERTPSEADPQISYGLGIDDMVVEWREFTLVKDATDCATGECAVIDVVSNNLYEASTSLTVTVLEKSPEAANDCDLDGDTDGTIDCNNDGRRDLVVRATSNTEFLGEIMYVDATATPNQFVGQIPVSSRYDSPGVLFIAQQATDAPVVTVSYFDSNDGSGVLCKNDVNPAEQGFVIATTTVSITLGDIQVISTILSDNGDNDGFADTNETVNMRIRLVNKGSVGLTTLAARVATNDPKIDCILDSFIFVGDLAAGGDVTTTDSFSFRVGPVDRAALGLTDLDDLSAQLSLGFAADQFDGLASTQSVIIDLDLDVTGGSGPTTFFEGFESGTLGQFQAHNIDAPLNSLQGSDGYRCQYADPDWPNANSYGQITDCFLAATQSHADTFYWNITPAAPGGVNSPKAFSGNRSLWMGFQMPNGPDFQTTPVSVMEAVRLTNPINLGTSGAPPELSYKHQVDLLDSRNLSTPYGQAPSRYVTYLQLASVATGAPVGNWIKLQPYVNVYDQTGNDRYFNCTFDPIDDGNDEDDFFDPTDPNRRLGPSTTCSPELTFVHMGETFLPFGESHVGNGEGPGLKGSFGIGTWVESKFNLERFRGRRARLRFLYSDIKFNGTANLWSQVFATLNPGPGDDGIWIDDVQVTNTLTSPATITVDNKANAGLPACGATCTSIAPSLVADPAGSLAAPGQVVELSSLASTADRCLDGVLQYQFWIDGDNDGVGGNSADTLMRAWTDNPNIVDAPTAATRYVVQVRCSTLNSCLASTSLSVPVTCPSSGNLTFPEVTAPTKTNFAWSRSLTYNWVRGRLDADGDAVSEFLNTGTYPTTGGAQNQGPGTTFSTAADNPTPTGDDKGFYYLFRLSGTLGAGGTGFCNAPPITWGNAGRDAALP